MVPAGSKTVTYEKQLEDPLAYLPCSSISEYRKGQIVYDQDQPSNGIHLVIQGKVKVCRPSEDGRQVVIDIYQRDEFFGESGLLGLTRRGEQAMALETTQLMSWTTAEIEDVTQRRPQLALALLQLLTLRCVDFGQRIESFSVDNIERRLIRTLLRFAERLGEQGEDAATRMPPFTHELLSQYVGTSREIITQYMNQFRRKGYLRYSRKGIEIYADAMREWLRAA